MSAKYLFSLSFEKNNSSKFGKFLVSYNDCKEIRELYDGCYFYSFKRVHSMVQKYEAGREFPELLIGNYDLSERKNNEPCQLTLF